MAENYFTRPIPGDILSIYWIQFSYYLSGVYLELYMDKKRKDSTMMLIHHFVTLALMYFSYISRYVNLPHRVIVNAKAKALIYSILFKGT